MQSDLGVKYFILLFLFCFFVVKKECGEVQKLYNPEYVNLSSVGAYCRSNKSTTVHGYRKTCIQESNE